ncbi:MAG: PASTA domain-containing protein [Sedimentisphaerales bacterium]|nr:PASTA domain-containing protein [Sedimentisphaerales bacterium]
MKGLFVKVRVIIPLCLYSLAVLAIPTCAKGDFTAYNDCVYDPGLVAYGTDPCGQSVHYGDPNYITVFGIGTPAVDHQIPPGVSYAASSGELIDYATGTGTGVTASLTEYGGVVWQPQVGCLTSCWSGGYDPAPGTDAYNTFNGIVDMTGTIYYGDITGWYVDIDFTGLDPNMTYTFATSASRAKDRTDGLPGYNYRISVYTISGVDSATNASTPGVVEYEPTRVRMNTGNNHFEGYVARWTDINPGADGTFKIRVEADSNSEGNRKAYAFDVFMLEETTPTVLVPDVIDIAQADANAAIIAAGLVVGTITTQCDNTIAAGHCISSNPIAGTALLFGSTVDLIVSTGRPDVPDVTDMNEADATAAINAVNDISYGSSIYICSDTVLPGNVSGQSAVGTVPCGTVVDLYISYGQPNVPDLTGLSKSAAIAAIDAVDDISYGSSSYEANDILPQDYVISQSATGTVSCDTVIDLVLSTGPCYAIIPDVTGMDEPNAVAALDAVNDISYSIYSGCSDVVPAGNIISQSVTGPAPCGTAIDLIVSYGQPSVPDLTDMSESEAINTINLIEDISYGSTSTACSDTIFAGNVMGQSATGTVPCGTEINLVVSYGQPVVPYLTGMTESAAIATINSIADISYGSSTYQQSETVPFGEVISQSALGTSPCGTVVDLVVSKGGPPTTIISNGTGGGDWHTTTTWIGGMVPRPEDDVVIQTGDEVTLTADGNCVDLEMESASKLTITEGGPIPGSSWALDPESTIEFNTVVPEMWVNPTFGNLTFNIPNYSIKESMTVAGDLNILNNTIRGIGEESGTHIHYVAGNVNISGSGRITAVNQTSPTSASCTWNIGGNVNTGSNYNRIQLYESSGPHTGSAVFNIDGNLVLGDSSYIMLKSTSSTTDDYPEGIINLKGDFIHDGTVSINSTVSGTSPGLSINFVGTSPQTWSGNGRFSVSAFTANMNINNPAGVILGSSRDISDNTAVVLTDGTLTTTSLNKLKITNGYLVGGSSASYINGPLTMKIPLGAQNITFHIGDTAAYTPVNIDLPNVYYSANMTASTTPSMHPQITTSGLDINKTLNRFYTVDSGQVLFTTATVTFNFDPNDVIGGADPNQYIVKRFDIVTWSTPTTANPLPTSIQATGLTAFGDFAIGHPCQTVVPDVTGMSEADAIAAINATANISYGSSYLESSYTVPTGYVISQSATGTVSCGTVIDLTISKGPDEFVARIMPLGDSITRGWWGSVYDDGYRKPLYEKLKAAHYNFDFMGSLSDGNFADPHHEGHDGWHADTTGEDDILGQVYNWLTAHPVDIILLHIGTNDITYGGPDINEVYDILDEIDRFSTDTTVILALIINRKTYSSITTQYNTDLYNMAQDRIVLGDDIIIVDMESALDYSTDMDDNVHPNDAGYAKMADVWFAALESILPSMYDLNLDGFIDWYDLKVIHENWLSNDPNTPGDFDDDGIVNFLDFAEFTIEW